MYLVEDTTGAIILMMLSLFCLGSWPAFFHVVERRGRHPQHTYLDYSIATFLIALLFAVTFGQLGPSSDQDFFLQLSQIQDNGLCVLIAMLGGLSLCIGNMLMQYSLVFLGISLTEVVSASIAVVGGTTVNYFLDDGLNQASLLFPGVGCFLVAILLGSLCHASNAKDINSKYEMAVGTLKEFYVEAGKEPDSANRLETPQDQEATDDCSLLQKQHKYVGSSEYFHHLEANRAIKVHGVHPIFGLCIAFLTGMCYALFSPLVNIATNDQFGLLQEGVPDLSVYTTFFHFSAAFLACAIVVNIYLLYNPVLGLAKSSVSEYLKDNKGRILAIYAGLVCGIGNGFQFMGGEAAGYAAADAVQALPLVGTFWGIILFREYHNSSRTTYILLIAMLVMFIIAVGLLVGSASSRF